MPTDEELAAAVQAARDEEQAKAKSQIEAAKAGKFTQEDLDRIAGESRKDGRGVAEKDLLKALGVESLDAAKAVLQAAKDAEDAQKTELQKAQEETVRLRDEAAAAQADAKSSRIQTALELKLRDAGINPARAAAALRLVDPSKLDVNGTEVTGLDDAVKELKSQSPEWFGTTASPPDASRGGGGPADFRTASAEDRDKALAQYGIRL